MGSTHEIAEFAESLRDLKRRSDRSYGWLATRLHVSTSTLHRYCNGDAVPADYAPVERFARLCGAAPEELIALHRRWMLADAARRRTAAPRGGIPGRPRGAGGAQPDAPTADGSAAAAQEPTEHPVVIPTTGDGTDVATEDAHGPAAAPAEPGTASRAARVTGVTAEGDATPGGPVAPAPTTGPRTADGVARGSGRRTAGAVRRARAGSAEVPPPGAPDAEPPSREGESTPRAARTPASGGGVRWMPVGGAAGGRGRLRAVPEGGNAAPRRGWRRRPWAFLAGAAAMAVLALIAVEVRPPGDDGKDAAAPRAGAHPRSAAPAGPTARGRLDRAGTGDATHPSGAPRGDGARRPDGGPSGSAAPSPGASDRTGGTPRKGGSRIPLTLTTRSHVWENGCDHRYLIDRRPADVAPPPTEQDAPTWAAAHGAVHGGTTNVEVTVQGRGSSAVVLRALHVRVVGRGGPPAWSSFTMENGCGGSLTPRAFSVDLDASRPLARPTDGNDAGTPLPAVRFPYRVSDTDPEVLRINARTVRCDCRWYLELDWSSGGREGTVRIDDHGVPFRTSGVKGRPEYGYDYGAGAWRENG
ncbi:helix-turn-helix domain-containing protein [Streptomyces cucumeris]|uniref:helix-turn-helix domain-containing protein n=1 Tax=Streptomyces cucumeris TaxID=2962890 RepID=UPI003D70D9DA